MGTAQGKTAAWMDSVAASLITAGAVDLSGHLIFTRQDGSTFDAGNVQGPAGEAPGIELPAGPSTVVYAKVAILAGIAAGSGGSAIFTLNGMSRILGGQGSVLVHAQQRGSNGVRIDAYERGTSRAYRFYTKQISEFVYEIWMKRPTYGAFGWIDIHATERASVEYTAETADVPVGLDESNTYYFSEGNAPGTIEMFAGGTVPNGSLRCDGSAVSRVDYGQLFRIIGTTYGAGDGVTTFNLPSLLGRVPVGYTGGQTEFDALGKLGGAKTHTLVTSEIPRTQIAGGTSGALARMTSSQYILPAAGAYNYIVQGNGDVLTVNGGGGAHNNLQPFIALNFIIWY